MSDPWFRFFPSDWISGVSGLSAAERGVYVTLLAIIYDRGGPVERDDARLARQCGLPKAGFVRALQALIDTGKVTEDDGRLFNKRAKNELTERENRIVKAKDAASSSWEKRKQNQQSKNSLAATEQSVSNATRARIPQPQPDKSPSETKAREARAAVAKEISDEFVSRFWPAWPNKVGKPDAAKAFLAARRRGWTCDQIMVGIERYIANKPHDRPWLNPSTFLNQDRWEDEPATPQARAGPHRPPEKRNTVFQAAQEMMAELYGGTDGTSERPSDDFNGTTLDLAVEPGGREDGASGANQAPRDDAAAGGQRGRYEGDVIDLHGPRGRFASG